MGFVHSKMALIIMVIMVKWGEDSGDANKAMEWEEICSELVKYYKVIKINKKEKYTNGEVYVVQMLTSHCQYVPHITAVAMETYLGYVNQPLDSREVTYSISLGG